MGTPHELSFSRLMRNTVSALEDSRLQLISPHPQSLHEDLDKLYFTPLSHGQSKSSAASCIYQFSTKWCSGANPSFLRLCTSF